MPKNHRIIIASRIYAPESAAAAFRLRALAVGLAAREFDVTVLTTRPPRNIGPAARDVGVEVSRFPVLRDATGTVRGYLQYLSFDIPLFFRLIFRRFDLAISEPPPTTGLVVAFVSAIRRRPYLYFAADLWSDAAAAAGTPAIVVRLLRWSESMVLQRSAGVLAVSKEVGQRVSELGARRVEIVGNGVDTSVFSPSGPTVPDTGPYLVYTGTMSEWQGAEVFVTAFEAVALEHPDLQLHFFGQGSREAGLKSTVGSPGKVFFHGLVPPAEAARWIRSATAALVSVKPGQGYDFAKPTKLYAAAACGVPVIFAGTGAGAELVTANQLGWVSPHDPQEVAKAIREAVADRANGTTESRHSMRAQWAADNASLASVGRRAASYIVQFLPRAT